MWCEEWCRLLQRKPIKLSPKRNGEKIISSFTINIGISEARECGFLDDSDNVLILEKVLDADNKQIIIKLNEK